MEAGGGRLSLGTHLQLHPQGCRPDGAAESTGGARSSETRLVSRWVCPVIPEELNPVGCGECSGNLSVWVFSS